jgi:hypothetical protein
MAGKPSRNFLRLLVKQHKQPRRIPKTYAKEVKKYSRQSGTILWAWNRIHAAFAESFVEIVDPNEPDVGLALWHAIKADTGQRDMLREALPVRRGIETKTAEALEWLLDVADMLSPHRNDIAHTPMAMAGALSGLIFEPDPFAGDPKRVARLGRPDREAFHKALTGDLIALSFYAMTIAMALRSPGLLLSWPRRPRLRSFPRGQVPLTRSQKRRRKPMQRRQRQPSPSHL